MRRRRTIAGAWRFGEFPGGAVQASNAAQISVRPIWVAKYSNSMYVVYAYVVRRFVSSPVVQKLIHVCIYVHYCGEHGAALATSYPCVIFGSPLKLIILSFATAKR